MCVCLLEPQLGSPNSQDSLCYVSSIVGSSQNMISVQRSMEPPRAPASAHAPQSLESVPWSVQYYRTVCQGSVGAYLVGESVHAPPRFQKNDRVEEVISVREKCIWPDFNLETKPC